MKGLRTAAVALWVPLWACGDAAETPAVDDGAPVRAERIVVESRPLPQWRSAPGQVHAIERAELATRLSGRLVDVAAREGDRVTAGQLLARVDDDDLAAHVARARAGLAEAEAAADLAEREAERARDLHAVDAARRALAAAEAQRTYGDVVAPFDGVVVARHADPGDLAAPGMPLLVVERVDSLRVDASLPESDVDAVPVGSAVLVVSGGDTLSARVRSVVPEDPRRRTFGLRVHLAAGGSLQAGRFARVHYGAQTRQAVWLPAEAIVERGQLRGAWIVQADRVLLRWLRLGQAVDGGVEVLSGLMPGDVVAIGDGLRDGARLAVSSRSGG
jgi:multidrug efflux system membrane fusion protein